MYNPHDLLRIDVTSVLKRNGDLPLWHNLQYKKPPTSSYDAESMIALVFQ